MGDNGGAGFPHEMFRAYDIRGVVGDSLTEELAERIGGALAATARERDIGEIVVGWDGRDSSEAIANALMRGLTGHNCEVLSVGMVPTPLLYFATAESPFASGVQVTGSHNPPQYNGFKITLGGAPLSGDGLQDLKERILRGKYGHSTIVAWRRKKPKELEEDYCSRLLADIRLQRPLRVVVDGANGVAGPVAPPLLRALGCEVSELYCEVDGAFPNHPPDPSDPENLADLRAAVRTQGADLGLAFDGDGDRLAAISGDGTVIWPDRLMLLFATDLLARHPGAEIIYDVKCTRLLAAAIRAAGGIATMSPTGHSLVKHLMRDRGALLAGEMSGHFFFADRWNGYDDALYAAARLCALLAADTRSPTEVFAALPDTVNTPELRVEMREGEAHPLVAKLAACAHFPDARVTTIDGVRVDFPDGFALVRASNTTPAMIMRFEADSHARLTAIQTQFRRLLHTVHPGLPLPF